MGWDGKGREGMVLHSECWLFNPYKYNQKYQYKNLCGWLWNQQTTVL